MGWKYKHFIGIKMAIDLIDLLKYGWMLLLTLIPKYLGTINKRFEDAERRDAIRDKNSIILSEKVAIIITKMDAQGDSINDLKSQSEKSMEILTDLRVQVNNQRR